MSTAPKTERRKRQRDRSGESDMPLERMMSKDPRKASVWRAEPKKLVK